MNLANSLLGKAALKQTAKLPANALLAVGAGAIASSFLLKQLKVNNNATNGIGKIGTPLLLLGLFNKFINKNEPENNIPTNTK